MEKLIAVAIGFWFSFSGIMSTIALNATFKKGGSG